MKKAVVLCFTLFAFLTSALVLADDVGPQYLKDPSKPSRIASPFTPGATAVRNAVLAGVTNGNLRLVSRQNDSLAEMEHLRYQQFYKGIPVFGGEVVFHNRNLKTDSLSGEYFPIPEMSVTPGITHAEAVESFRRIVGKEGLQEKVNATDLTIYPRPEGGYRLAYRVTLTKDRTFSETALVDAKSGEILLRFSNIKYDSGAIGFGYGVHGEAWKLATVLSSNDNKYYLADEKFLRPINQYTFDWKIGAYIPSDTDNNWGSSYPEAVSAHAFMGMVYDFYNLFYGRKGIDNNNLDVEAVVNYDGISDNAFWSSEYNSMFFGIPGAGQDQYAGTLDVIGHEFSHGVTDFASNLTYAFQSGALNESFSDIMGTLVEFYWLPEGTGLLKADWLIGEDSKPTYTSAGCRNLVNPNLNSQFGDSRYPDPAHLTQYYSLPYNVDYGGVHVNCTIFPHAFYLLAHGGTNPVSQMSVTGIGLNKAAYIYYRAWVNYLTSESTFLNAANALVQSAKDLYGNSSTEYQQVIQSMLAIGFK